jgi:hypothetical protein
LVAGSYNDVTVRSVAFSHGSMIYEENRSVSSQRKLILLWSLLYRSYSYLNPEQSILIEWGKYAAHLRVEMIIKSGEKISNWRVVRYEGEKRRCVGWSWCL